MNLSKKQRLLRVASIIIILRDELEELEQHPEWVQVANEYIELLTSHENEEVNDQYWRLFTHIDKQIREYFQPSEVINELFKVLQKDFRTLGAMFNSPIKKATEAVEVREYDIWKLKIIDSVSRNI